MSTDATNNRSSDYQPLSFDASVAGGPATCVNCGVVLRGSYHTINDQMACSKCRFAAEEQVRGGTSAGGLVRAVVFGTGAAIVGAAGYYAFVKITSIEWALLTGLVGLGVGIAVRKGGMGHGGLKFQIIALILAWFAMAGAYMPFMAEGAMQGAASTRKEVLASAKARADSIDAENESVAEPDSAALAAAVRAHAAVKAVSDAKLPADAIAFVIVLGLLASPILVAVGSPISGLFIAYALYRAWKVNAGGASISVAGPFKLASTAPPPAAA